MCLFILLKESTLLAQELDQFSARSGDSNSLRLCFGGGNIHHVMEVANVHEIGGSGRGEVVGR